MLRSILQSRQLLLHARTRNAIKGRKFHTSKPKNGGVDYTLVSYRSPAPINPVEEFCSDLFMTFFWGQIFWHIYWRYEYVLAPHSIDPSRWTDADLGITEDDI